MLLLATFKVKRDPVPSAEKSGALLPCVSSIAAGELIHYPEGAPEPSL